MIPNDTCMGKCAQTNEERLRSNARMLHAKALQLEELADFVSRLSPTAAQALGDILTVGGLH